MMESSVLEDRDEEDEDEDDDDNDNDNDKVNYEEVQLGSEFLELPSELLEKRSVLDSVLSIDTWERLSLESQEHLKTFLPGFPLRDAEEKERSLRMLFDSSNFNFGNPLTTFKVNLLSGKYHPEQVRLESLLRRAQRRIAAQKEKERSYLLLQDILTDRKKLLDCRTGHHTSTPLSVLKMEKKSIKTGPDISYRVSKRYHRELRLIRSAAGQSGDSSEDEGCPPLKSPKKKEINLLESDYWKTVVKNEVVRMPEVTSSSSETQHRSSKRGRPPKKESLLSPQTLENLKKVSSNKPQFTVFPSQPTHTPPPINEVSIIEEAVANIPGMEVEAQSVANAILSSETLLSPEMLLPTTPLKPDELPPHTGLTPPPPEVVVMSPPRVTHVQSYFVLLRDIFLCHPDFKITIPSLEEAVRNWQNCNANNPPNWFSWAECWVTQIPSAVAFLTGAFPDAQPKDFSPYIDCDPTTGNYEWIGSGRDSDADLVILKQWWFERRDVCRAITTGGGNLPPEAIFNQIQQTPSPHQQSATMSLTDWTVRPSTDEEKAIYRVQEQSRYSQPGQAFTYHVHGYSTTVGPIRGVGSFPSKAKNHILLVVDRPPCITILCLVKDAVARLPNGEGTRPDIVELIKDSQYINPNSDPQTLTSAVSGALDRLQSEADPCVKYESIKKTWSYLHRGRTEEEFMRIYNEQLSLPKSALKPKRPKSRKQPMTFPNTTAIASSPKNQSVLPPQSVLETALAGVSLPNEAKEISSENLLMNSVQALLPQVPLPPASPPPTPHRIEQIQLQQPLTSENVQTQQKQTVQLMTPSGLKTYQFSIPVQNSSTRQPTSVNPSKALAATTSTILKQSSQSLLLDQSGNRINNLVNSGKTVVYNYQKPSIPVPMKKIETSKLITNSHSQQSILFSNKNEIQQQETGVGEVRISVPSSHPGHRQTVQRVIVKNSEGKPVQLSAASLQKLLSSGALKSSLQLAMGGANKTSIKSQPSNSIIVQQQPSLRQAPQRYSQVLSSSNLKGHHTVHGVRYVQLRSPLNSSTNPNVRILSSSNQRPSPIRLANNTKVLSLPQQQVVSSNNALSRTVKVPLTSHPFSVQRGTGHHNILSSSSKSQVVQLSQSGNVITSNNNQQQQLVIQSSGGKPIVLSQQALQNARITNLQNVRVVQSHHQSSISPDGKILTRIIHPGSTSK